MRALAIAGLLGFSLVMGSSQSATSVPSASAAGFGSPTQRSPLALNNPGFETPYAPVQPQYPTVTGDIASGWKDNTYIPATVAYSQTTDAPREGASAQRVEVTAPADAILQVIQALPDASPTEAQLYRASVWLRGTPGLLASVFVLRAGEPYDQFGESLIQLTDSWQLYTVLARVPAGASSTFIIQLDGVGRIDIDDASASVESGAVNGVAGVAPIARTDFGQHTSDTIQTSLRNGEMEGAYVTAVTSKPRTTTGGVAPSWNANSDFGDVTVDFGADGSVVHGGSTSQRIDVKEIRQTGVQLTQGQLLVSPAMYNLSIWANGEAGQNVTLEMRKDGEPYDLIAGNSAAMDGTWKQITVSVAVPADVNKTYIAVSLDGVGKTYLDDVVLTKSNGRAIETRWPGTNAATFRTWDTITWSKIEPTKGVYNWAVLDAVVTQAQSKNGDVILTLGQSPTWASPVPDESSFYGMGAPYPPSNVADWTDFVRAVAARYGNKIGYYEIWNEPNDPTFGKGTIAQLVALTKATRETLNVVNPAAKVITPSAYSVGWLNGFLAAGGGQWSDIVGYHIYNAKPEDDAPILANVRTVMADYGITQPLWLTEGGTGTPTTAENDQAALLARKFLVDFGWGSRRFAWYTWGRGLDISGPTVQSGNLKINAAGRAMGRLVDWMSGSTVTGASNSNGVWVVDLKGANGKRQQFVWSPDGAKDYTPDGWKPRQATTLDGVSNRIKGPLSVGPSPIWLR
jgi:Carbohydrate binding domain/Beta-galactosidase